MWPCCARMWAVVGRSGRVLALLLASLGAMQALGQLAQGQAPPAEAPPLPLRRVVLYSSSVGFFEHGGPVEGNQQIEFSFPADGVDDLLKSMVVQDRDGGLIVGVNYGSPDPLERTLRTFTIDLSESPTLAEIFQQLRGQEVKLETPTAVTGTVVGVEQRSLPSGPEKFALAEVLNLKTSEGLRSVRLDAITRTQFISPKIDREFQQALVLLAGARTNDQRRVKLDFRGAGKRRVDVGYIQEAAVWKTSYRLVLSDDAPPFLQGWAIVENSSTQDWRDVQLTLVSGQPISFVMNLSQPLFMTRPFVEPERHAGLAPKVYEQDLQGRGPRQGPEAGGGFGGGFGGGAGGFAGGGGGTFGAPANRPLVTTVVPVVDPTAPQDNTLKPDQGVQAAAVAGEVGELFRYAIKTPVTLPRGEASLLPIVNEPVKGEKVSIYNPAVHARHPLAGFRLTNATELHLLQGPVTVFDGGEYAGDARIDDLAPGGTRLVSYALDLDVEIAVKQPPAARRVQRLRIAKGVVEVTHRLTRRTIYTIKNSSTKARTLLLEQPLAANWKATQPPPTETTRSLHRHQVTAAPKQSQEFVVTEEGDDVFEFKLADWTAEDIAAYLKEPVATPKLVQLLESLIQGRSRVAEAEAALRSQVLQTELLAAEQQQVRTNMQAIPAFRTTGVVSEENKKASNDLLGRYLKRMGELDAELKQAREQQRRLEAQHAAAQQALDKLLSSAAVE